MPVGHPGQADDLHHREAPAQCRAGHACEPQPWKEQLFIEHL